MVGSMLERMVMEIIRAGALAKIILERARQIDRGSKIIADRRQDWGQVVRSNVRVLVY